MGDYQNDLSGLSTPRKLIKMNVTGGRNTDLPFMAPPLDTYTKPPMETVESTTEEAAAGGASRRLTVDCTGDSKERPPTASVYKYEDDLSGLSTPPSRSFA